jgi:hypothetical protein
MEDIMNILGIVRQIGSLPGVRRPTLSVLAKSMALLEGLNQAEHRRRKRRRKPAPPPPK